jgi:hypothetical protein
LAFPGHSAPEERAAARLPFWPQLRFLAFPPPGESGNYDDFVIYLEEEPGRRPAAKLMTRDEARRIAANIAKLPDQE